jgi:uncharacterized protein YjbJ (UPF0337 family)
MDPSTQDKAEGKVDQLKGKGQETWGQMSGNADTEAKGKANQTTGHLKEAVGHAKDAIGHVVSGLKKPSD